MSSLNNPASLWKIVLESMKETPELHVCAPIIKRFIEQVENSKSEKAIAELLYNEDTEYLNNIIIGLVRAFGDINGLMRKLNEKDKIFNLFNLISGALIEACQLVTTTWLTRNLEPLIFEWIDSGVSVNVIKMRCLVAAEEQGYCITGLIVDYTSLGRNIKLSF